MLQRTRFGVIAVFASGLVVGVAAILYLGGGKERPSAPKATAAEQEAAKARVLLAETGPGRNFDHKPYGKGTAAAMRDVYPDGKAQYYVYIHIQQSGWTWKLATEDVSALVKLEKQLKDQKKADAAEIAQAQVFVTCYNHELGKDRTFTYVVGTGWKDGLDAAFFATLEQTLKDVETLKAVKPTVRW